MPKTTLTRQAAAAAAASDQVSGRTSRKLLECQPGVVRLFGIADIGQNGLVSGWAFPEEGHTWNEGYDAVLAVSAASPPGPCSVVVEGEPYVSRQQPVQDVTIYANGRRAGFWRLSERTEFDLQAPIEPEWWFERGDIWTLKLVFHLPNSVRPCDIGDGADGREIGFCFRTFQISNTV
jgi:hypothetical protein